MKNLVGVLKVMGMMVLTLGISVTTVLASEVNKTSEVNKKDEKITHFYGILIDAHCSGAKVPEKHPKACSVMPKCASSGYGIDVQQADGSIRFYRFDPKGEELAKAYLKATQKENNLAVIVEGNLTEAGINVATLQEDARGIYELYKLSLSKEIKLDESLLKVKEEGIIEYGSLYVNGYKVIYYIINEPSTQEKPKDIYEGILQDKHCFGKVDPEIDTKMCLTMNECADSGYGIVIKDANGKKSFYAFDANGNKKAKQILATTTKDSKIIVKVKGDLVGQNIKIKSIEEIK